MSGRLEEMPGEEGYPAYLGTRMASFYERAGRAICLGKDGREGAVSVIGAVSPPGGDLSEPVTQNTLRVAKVFWSLDAQLAYQRHFPAINWLNSYSLYTDTLGEYWDDRYDGEWNDMRIQAMSILEEEDQLKEIVRLVGIDALSREERMTMETAKSLREDFLHQNSFHEVDTYASMDKQVKMLRNILTFNRLGMRALSRGALLREVINMPVREEIARMRYTQETMLDALDATEARIKEDLGGLAASGGEKNVA
jgi:V/A-type H+-transporting ATPase subunit A